MEQIEAIRGYRPLEADEWLGNFQATAIERFGQGALDFCDEELGVKEVELLGASRFMAMRGDCLGPTLGRLSVDEILSTAREDMCGSFGKVATLTPTYELGVTHITDCTEQRKRVLTADVKQKRLLGYETRCLEDVVEKVAERRLPWIRPPKQVKLATIQEGTYIRIEDLKELSELLPEKIRLKRGRIKPVLIDAQPAAIAA